MSKNTAAFTSDFQFFLASLKLKIVLASNSFENVNSVVAIGNSAS
jgi:hypothetical protein